MSDELETSERQGTQSEEFSPMLDEEMGDSDPWLQNDGDHFSSSSSSSGSYSDRNWKGRERGREDWMDRGRGRGREERMEGGMGREGWRERGMGGSWERGGRRDRRNDFWGEDRYDNRRSRDRRMADPVDNIRRLDSTTITAEKWQTPLPRNPREEK